MAIQNRRGLKKDFNPQKMLPGEWAVSTDPETENQIIWMCFRQGIVKRMGTYEDFKEQVREATEEVKEEYEQTFNEIKVYMEGLKNTTEGYKNTASQKATQASNSATQASQSASSASSSATNAANSADLSENYSKQAKSYAKGTGGKVRPNDDSDCAEFYYEQVKRMAQGVEGIIPMGTITFAELSLPHNEIPKYMFDISDDFVTDERFKNGSGIYYGAGSNVIRTADNMWDVLAPVSVSGVKGDKENTFRQGLVNITPDDIGIQEIGKTLKGYTLVGADSDMDDYKSPGNYCVHTSNLASLGNKPPIPDNTAACIFRVEDGYTNGLLASKPAVRQRFQQFLRPYIWERCLYNESWTDWELVQTSEPLNMQSGWSLSGGTEIVENADLNASEYLEIGNYYCPGNVVATLQNCPITDAFTMKVSMPDETGCRKQTIIARNAGDVWIRVFDDVGTIVKDWTLIAADQSKKVDASKIVGSTEITEPGFLMDGKTASDALKELNGRLTATITPSTGFTYSSNNVVKKGHIVMVYAKVSGTINSGGNIVIGTLPQGFRPETRCVFIASSDTTIFHERLAKITIMTDGEIRVLSGGINLTGVQLSTVFISGESS